MMLVSGRTIRACLVCAWAVLIGTGLAFGQSGGMIVAWGNNSWQQCDVPAPNNNFTAIAAGYAHSLGLKSNGSIVTWWYDPPAIPEPNSNFVAIDAIYFHALGRKSNGQVVAWGINYYNQFSIPEPNIGYRAVAAGYSHGLGLRSVAASGVEDIEYGGVPAVAGLEIRALVPNPFNPATDVSATMKAVLAR